MPDLSKIRVSSSPHIWAEDKTRTLMIEVALVLLFPLSMGVFMFGWGSLLIASTCVGCCIAFEFAYQCLLKKPVTIGDCSAVVTGMLIAVGLPSGIPLWMCVIASFFAIVIVKQLYGGLGKNFLNPALAARVFLLISFPAEMTAWPAARVFETADAVASATPLAIIKGGNALTGFNIQELLFGMHGGCIGETSILVLAACGIYLLLRGVITARIPVAFIGTVALLTFLFPLGGNGRVDWMLWQVLGGGLFLGAVFMATDYTTSPVGKGGQWLYGVGCGLLTVFIRYFGAFPEGVSFAILLMNTTVWLIDRYIRPMRYGDRLFKRRSDK